MRPVNRPAYSGESYTRYKNYLGPLVAVFGSYCSYCERPDKLDVEHIVPQSKAPQLALQWDNFLLGCPRCNRDFKRSKNDSRVGYVWPDTHNTFHLLHYFTDGRVKPTVGLDRGLQAEVQATIDLVKLDDSKETQKVLCLGRRRAFKLAERAKAAYVAGSETLEEVLDEAAAGYWSIWYLTFADLPEVATALSIGNPNYPNTAIAR